MPIDVEKQRARWRRNKASERRIKKANEQARAPIDPDFEKSVWAERDKRRRNFSWEHKRLVDGRPFARRTCSKSLVCDVWAAELILSSYNPDNKISDGKIATCLIEKGKHHNVKATSLRTKVWRARQVVRFLEDAPARDGEGRYWPKFPDSVAEDGSGLVQHIKGIFPDFDGF